MAGGIKCAPTGVSPDTLASTTAMYRSLEEGLRGFRGTLAAGHEWLPGEAGVLCVWRVM